MTQVNFMTQVPLMMTRTLRRRFFPAVNCKGGGAEAEDSGSEAIAGNGGSRCVACKTPNRDEFRTAAPSSQVRAANAAAVDDGQPGERLQFLMSALPGPDAAVIRNEPMSQPSLSTEPTETAPVQTVGSLAASIRIVYPEAEEQIGLASEFANPRSWLYGEDEG